MNPGYFASYSRVLSQTVGYTEQRDYLEQLLALVDIKKQRANSMQLAPKQSAVRRTAVVGNGIG